MSLYRSMVGGLSIVCVAAYLLLSPQQVVSVKAYRAARAISTVPSIVSGIEAGAISVSGARYASDDRAVVTAEAERALEILLTELHFQPRWPIRIYLDRETSHQSGSYSMGRVIVQAPSLFNGSYRGGGPVLHELTHLAVDYLAHGNYPHWLTEGVAVYVESKHLDELWIDLESPVTWRGFDDMERGFSSKLTDVQNNSYRLAFHTVDYLYSREGAQGMRRLLRLLGRGERLVTAMHSVYGLSLEELDQEVGVYLRARQEAVVEGRTLRDEVSMHDGKSTIHSKSKGWSR